MTREEAIKRWTDIASTVFRAEHNIMPALEDMMKSARTMTKEGQAGIAERYCRAIAEEIVSKTSDEELAGME